MIKGARQLPAMHLSVRVPWHDERWAGNVCRNPRGNTSCLVLPRIAESRDDVAESDSYRQPWNADGIGLPACAAERGAFMSPTGYSRRARHPYSHDSRYTHFRETHFHHPAHSAGAVPFAWMMKEKDGIPLLAKDYRIDFKPDLEPELKFDSTWVQERRNQLAMLDTFFSAVVPEESLVFFYAKRTPLTDDNRRVIVGIGRALKVDDPVEYSYEDGAPPKDGMRCVLWERNIHHSIRPAMLDGFLMPYHDLLELAEKDPDIDIGSLVLHAPDEYRAAFSMGSEHVTHDQAITVLLSCQAMLGKWEKLVPGDWRAAREWIDRQLNRLWRMRGAFPGLGSTLSALGISHGTLIAYAIGRLLHEDGSQEVRDPWPMVDKVIRDPKLLPADLATMVGASTAKLWEGLRPERRALLKLLARFEITADQAKRWFVAEERAEAGIDVSDDLILKNPYLCYEADRGQPDAIGLGAIDRGLFPAPEVAAAVPIPEPSACGEPIDERRGRALMLDTMDRAAREGHTLLPQSWLVQRVRDLGIAPKCEITSDWVETFSASLKERFVSTAMADGSAAWQLREYADMREIISARVNRRLAGKRHAGDRDWRALIDAELPPFAEAGDPEMEEAARQEKATALEELYRSRFSVLIGPAGTGKTSLLTALIKLPSVAGGGVLLLAPTGKARVQMQRRAAGASAFTLAQFLLGSGRYDPETGRYLVTNEANRENGYKTVIIDESSMLTEDHLAATLDAIESAAVERLILVGDPRQLPPIGAGRPFVDVVRHLKEKGPTPAGKATGYAELRIVRRQTGSVEPDPTPGRERDDILLSKWFGGDAPDAGADEVWGRLIAGEAIGVRAVQWETEAELQEKLLGEVKAVTRAIAKRFGYEHEKDDALFEISLGGRPGSNGVVYFNSSNLAPDRHGTDVESWQILSPLRAGETGVDGVNRWLQKTFRQHVRKWAEPADPRWRKTCEPLGNQGILYGDKVINIRNQRRHDVYPEIDEAYLANGEIGLVIGQYKSQKWEKNPKLGKKLPWKLEVEFSSQPELKFGFSKGDFGDERDPSLELAYALTIHKSQGSEFGVTFVVVPNPCRLLSRELLYTALTRQRELVVLLHQGDLRSLLKLSSDQHSDTARRITNLFTAPKPVEHIGVFFEEGLIHRTARGEMVRSKSEVIIANLLHSMGISYAYEQPFTGKDGSVKYPDFTIEDAETGQRVFLEHLGLLHNSAYKRRWDAKVEWYRDQGVLSAEEGEGDGGLLLTTTEENGFDSAVVEKKLRTTFGT